MSRAGWHLQANCVAIHEFGKDLEAQVGKLQYLAVLVFSAYASGLFMVVTNRPIGAEAFLPVGASGGTCLPTWKCILCPAALFFCLLLFGQGRSKLPLFRGSHNLFATLGWLCWPGCSSETWGTTPRDYVVTVAIQVCTVCCICSRCFHALCAL